MKVNLTNQESFENRHQGKSSTDNEKIYKALHVSTLDQLILETVPEKIRLENPLDLPKALSENEFLKSFKELASKNIIAKSFIGTGYYDTIVPNVILRNILENPSWYTAYTPYQAEIAQGRLEMLLNFQTLVCDLTSMEIANASLLDEGTAAAEAMSMFYANRKAGKKNSSVFFISELCHPQTIELVKGRALPIGVDVLVGDHKSFDFTESQVYAALFQYPCSTGELIDYTDIIENLHEQGISCVVAADLLSLTLFKSPGEMGADAVIGCAQRFGVPMGYGGPHAAFFATKEEFKRQIPGRIIGVSIDSEGNRALRMALQTREQHIRREKATSNICTAQVLLSVMASAYSIYHGPEGLKNIALKIHGLTKSFANAIQGLDYRVLTSNYFDTITLDVLDNTKIREIAESKNVNLRYHGTEDVSISFDQTKSINDVALLLEIFAEARGEQIKMNLKTEVTLDIPDGLVRKSTFMQHAVFNSYHTEHEMLRYLKSLESKDLSLVHSMISLGSCTMKLNATAEMIPVTWPEIGNIHPFAPISQTQGYQEMFENLSKWLCEITGFDAMSLQPNSGAQGEYAGLMVIRAFHQSKGDHHRNIALIPSSAHGTNPASAVMAGMKVVVTKCDDQGNIDLVDLREKAELHAANLACLMVTYPSTHGVFEETIIEICDMIHGFGGRVYMDGANMNAQVGLTSPGRIGADVCHLNLHKTFCIPHGGGGPGMGPIGVVKDLAPFLPSNAVVAIGGDHAINGISAAPWGSASILPISYAYIAMMGGEGLTNATKTAILNANYIKSRLEQHFEILYTGANGRCAHEMIVDCRPFKMSAGVEVEDIAKRLMDYGFHAPTVSFPVAGTLMIEPTESESLHELDRFCDALIAIRKEISEIEAGQYTKEDNVLVHAPHTMRVVMAEQWTRGYSREKAAFPFESLKFNKFWPSVSRIDSAYGDRNLVCACEPTEAYA
jgi:glycine dehydrogenase